MKIRHIPEQPVFNSAASTALPTPSAGNAKMYRKEDGYWYEKDDAGVEKRITSATVPIGEEPATVSGAVSIAQGLLGAFSDALKAGEGDVGKTTFYVQAVGPAGDLCAISCSEDGLLFINDVFIQSMKARDTYQYTAQTGDKIYMKAGALAAVNRSDSDNAPIEVNNTANAGKEFFWNRFRETNGNEWTTATLPIETTIEVYGPDPVFVDGVVTGTPQHSIKIAGGATENYFTNGIGEYYMVASQPVIHSSSNYWSNTNVDTRAINPPVRKLIGHTRSGGGNNMSSLREDNNITVYQRSGEIGTFVASPGAPTKVDVGIGGNADFDPNDIGVAVAEGEICAYAGADSNGRNACQWQDTRAASNNFILTLDIEELGSGNSISVLYGEYECEWSVYLPDGSYLGEIEMRRGTGNNTASPATTKEHQLHPAAVNFDANDGIFAGITTIQAGTQFISNMPAFNIANYTHSADGIGYSDETTVHGSVLPSYLCETRTRRDGLVERLVLDEATGVSTWVSA